MALAALWSAPAKAASFNPAVCQALLTSERVYAAVYKIDIGGGDEESGYGDVVVIRDGTGGEYDPSKPEMDIGGGGIETGNDRPGGGRDRREIEQPGLELPLQEIVPEREEKRKQPPIPAILPFDPAKIDPVKKPPKPLPN